MFGNFQNNNGSMNPNSYNFQNTQQFPNGMNPTQGTVNRQSAITSQPFIQNPASIYNGNAQGPPTSSIISAPPMMTGGLNLAGGNALLSNLQNSILMGLKPPLLPMGGNNMFPNQNLDMNLGNSLPMNLLPNFGNLNGGLGISLPLGQVSQQPNQMHQGQLLLEGGDMVHGAPPVLIPQLPPPKEKSDSLKKVFVRNIPEDIPDDFLESLFRECGKVVSWKRTKNEKNVPVSFGYCEFEHVEGVLRCLRIMNNMKLLEKELQVNPSERTELFIKEWMELKKREWELRPREDNSSGDPKEFDSQLGKDDDKVIVKIKELVNAFDIRKIRDAKEKEEEKKEHVRERERDSRKRQLRKDLERKYKEKLSEWLRKEEEKERDRKRDKEKEKEKQKEKQKLIQRELDYDSDEEKRKKTGKYFPKAQDRKKLRMKELEEDEMERRKEIQTMDIQPPEPKEIMPEMNPPSPEREERENENKIEIEEVKRPTVSFTFQTDVLGGEPQISALQMNPDRMQEANMNPVLLNWNLQDKNKQKSGTNLTAFSNAEDEEGDSGKHGKKHKPLTKLDRLNQNDSLKPHAIQIDMNSKKAVINFAKNEQQEEEQKKASVQSILNSETFKKELENIIKKIPTKRNDLFDYPINWTLFATSNLLEKKVKPWLTAKSIEYIGSEEPTFISMILKKVANKDSPAEILKKVEKVLDEDAEDFVMKMWRMIIFELLKAEYST